MWKPPVTIAIGPAPAWDARAARICASRGCVSWLSPWSVMETREDAQYTATVAKKAAAQRGHDRVAQQIGREIGRRPGAGRAHRFVKPSGLGLGGLF
jgi:hypothetical protein